MGEPNWANFCPPGASGLPVAHGTAPHAAPHPALLVHLEVSTVPGGSIVGALETMLVRVPESTMTPIKDIHSNWVGGTDQKLVEIIQSTPCQCLSQFYLTMINSDYIGCSMSSENLLASTIVGNHVTEGDGG